MKRRTSIIAFAAMVIIIIAASIYAYSYYSFTVDDDFNPQTEMNQTISIANWNLQIFGDSKANNTELMQLYVQKISRYDIIFLQELRDKDGSSFVQLCDMLASYGYLCANSSRAGRSSSKEQYGVVYKNKFNMTIIDYNPDGADRWERPPVRADFSLGNYSFTLYNIHTKPDNVTIELKNLESLIDAQNDSRNVIVLGDLNADCYYYNPYSGDEFSVDAGWHRIIGNDADTTSGPSNCAYDRIILNDDAYGEYIYSGVDNEGITEDVSDHDIVWTLIRDHDFQKDKTFKAYMHYLGKWQY